MSFLMVFSSFCISLVHTKWLSHFSKPTHEMGLLGQIGDECRHKVHSSQQTLQLLLIGWCSKRCDSFHFLWTWLDTLWSDDTSKVLIAICCFLMKHLLGLNLSPGFHAFSTVSSKWMPWRSSVDPFTLTSYYAHGNVLGMPARIQSMCSQKMLTIQRQGIKLQLIQAPMRLNFPLWRPNPEN